MKTRLALILLGLLALLGVTATGALADDAASVPVLAEPFGFSDGGDVPLGMIVVFVREAPDGFSDGGDGFSDGGDGFSDGGDATAGYKWVIAGLTGDGFSDGGDVPSGYLLVAAQPVGVDFWLEGKVPDGLVPVLAWPGEGFSDGGDVPDGYIPALLPTTQETARTPPGG
jgi:hypothetical protein